MKSSSISRTLELAKLAARVGLKELQSGDLKSRYDQAVIIAKSLSNLKGVAMKMGQLLSLDLDNYFPPEAIEVLSQLQNAAVAHPFEEMERILKSELTLEDFHSLHALSKSPLGVASIGQVHKAKFQDQDIVLKIQYPGVATSIESDLKILRTLAVSFCQMTGRKMNLEPLFQEFRSILEQETDYSLEASFQKQFQDRITTLNAAGHFSYRVPTVIDELSTQKVLAMSFESGVTLRSWINSKPNQEDRESVARAILDLYFHEFFEWGLVQTDPNWGNFLIDKHDRKLSLCLLDFGATRAYSAEFIRNYICLLEFAANKESSQLKSHAIDFGLIDARESDEAFVAFENMLGTAIKPFFAKSAGKTYFDFSDRNHALESQSASKALAAELIYSPPPYSLIFLHRKLAGVYSVLKSLEVKLDISPYWHMMRDLSEKPEPLAEYLNEKVN